MSFHDKDPRNGAELLLAALEAEGVDTLFGYPGGAIMPVYDALHDSDIQHVLVRHEQGAALAAGGYARASGRVGVCMATSGPGATNLVTGIADAFMDSVPIVAITGQVPTSVLGTDAFQEVDIFGITLPIVKHSWQLRSIDDLVPVVRQAFAIAREGRPGPVLIDLPKDVATAPAKQRHLENLHEAGHSLRRQLVSTSQIERAFQFIAAAKCPVVYAGGGVGLADAVEPFRRFVERAGFPTVTTLHGIGALPTDHPMLLGMLGMHGSQAANLAVQECDLLICLGARFDDRATGRLDRFAPLAKVVHVDIDPAELGKLRRAQAPVCGDLRTVLDALEFEVPVIDAWRELCLSRVERDPLDAPGAGVYAPAFLAELTGRDPSRWTVTCDVGQHQMWVAQHARFADPAQHVTSGGLGTMGFGVPAAIGAVYANTGREVIAISGDGSLMMNIQELATIARYELPVKIVVLDNSGLGLVRQWQTLFFDGRHSEVDLSDNPDFATVAEAFGVPAIRIASRHEVQKGIEAIENTKGPLLIHVPIDSRANVWPLVPPMKANQEMMLERRRCTTG